MTSTNQTNQTQPPPTDPDVARTVRLLHRRHGWGRTAATSFIAFCLAYGGYLNAQNEGAPAPTWFGDIVVALGALTVLGVLIAVVDTVLLRRRSPAVRAQAAAVAARHPSRRSRTRHYPPRHWVSWAFRWLGMLLIVAVAVISVPAVVDGVAYLAGAEHTVAFDPLSYQTNCTQYGCSTSTYGVMETGGSGTAASWPNVVPLGKPFQIRKPMWNAGLGEALIDSDGTAVLAAGLSLLMEAFAVFVVIRFGILARNWLRYRQERRTVPTVPVP
jgi:hypothetical protein